MKGAALIILMSLALTSCSSSAPQASDRLLVVRNATVLGGPALERLEQNAIVVRDGRIAWIGADSSLPAWAAGGETIDASGMTVLPGLVDAHAHIAGLGAALDTVDLVAASSYEEVIERILEDSRDKPSGEWILGRGWDQNDWPVKEFPDAATLDRSVGNRPVWVVRIDGHAGLASSAAMKAARITAQTPDPEGGRILRNADGTPTGVFIDTAMDLVARVIPPPSRQVRRARIVEAARNIAGRGLTAVHDAGVDQDTIQLMRELIDAGELPIRVYVMLADDNELLDYWFNRGPLLDYGDHLTVRSVKLYADGALGSRGAALLAPYSDDPSNSGLMIASSAHVARRSQAAMTAGFQVGTHAIGDRAVRNVIDAYASAGVRPEQRFRIEHLQVVSPEDFSRLSGLGIISSMQPTHATSDMPWAEDRLGADRVRGAYAWRTVLDAGSRLALGSDFPVEQVDPFLGIYAAVTRQDAEGAPAGGWFADQRLTLEEAIRGFTLDAAFAAFEEDRRGTIEVGKWADLTIVEPEPRATAPGLLPATKVRYTIVNGRLVHRGE
jgi:predicted amidohydrolase YtcJ